MPETKGRTLEEISRLFGDEYDVNSIRGSDEMKQSEEHIEKSDV